MCFLFQAEDGIRDLTVTGVQTCALPISLPTALRHPVVVVDEEDRPQPRRDVEAGEGMAAVVGRIRECPLHDVKLTLLSHNLVRGAAGAGLFKRGMLSAPGIL